MNSRGGRDPPCRLRPSLAPIPEPRLQEATWGTGLVGSRRPRIPAGIDDWIPSETDEIEETEEGGS